MKRQLPALTDTAEGATSDLPDGIFRVRVTSFRFSRLRKQSGFVVSLEVLEPEPYRGSTIVSRLETSDRLLWRLDWFLRDFGYSADALASGEIDEQAVVGLRGVIKLRSFRRSGRCFHTLDSFAPDPQRETEANPNKKVRRAMASRVRAEAAS